MKKIIQKVIEKHKHVIQFAYIFGSQVQGAAIETSDIDIALFLNNFSADSLFDIKINLYLDLTRALKRNDVDLVIMNRCNNIILLNRIITRGYPIYDQNKAERLDYEQKILHSAIDFKEQRKMAMGV